MRRIMTITDTHRPRGGFSLVELLVVMAIITILASLAFVVLGASGNAAREASTKSLMRVLSGALRERVDAFHEITASFNQIDPDLPQSGSKARVFREQVLTFERWYFNAGNPDFPIPANPVRRKATFEVFVRKAMYKAWFPQREEDLYGYNGALDNGGLDDSPLLARMYSGGSLIPTSWKGRNVVNPVADSSELLYLSLTDNDVLGLPPAEIAGIDSHLIGDTDGDGNLEFLDGWGRPLQFYNWPSRLIKDDGLTFSGVVAVGANQYPTASLLVSNLPRAGATGPVSATVARNRADRDPEDPTRLLAVILPLPINGPPPIVDPRPNVAQGTFPLLTDAGVTINAQKFNSYWYHDINTVTMPLVVSAGQDGVLGLHLPTENGVSGTDHRDRLARVIHTDEACQALGDNITNQQRGPQ